MCRTALYLLYFCVTVQIKVRLDSPPPLMERESARVASGRLNSLISVHLDDSAASLKLSWGAGPPSASAAFVVRPTLWVQAAAVMGSELTICGRPRKSDENDGGNAGRDVQCAHACCGDILHPVLLGEAQTSCLLEKWLAWAVSDPPLVPLTSQPVTSDALDQPPAVGASPLIPGD